MSDFHLGQWNDPAWREKHQPANAPTSPTPESSELVCLRCGSPDLRSAGFYSSTLWPERKQNVRCHVCKAERRLPVGVELPRKEKPELPVELGPPHCSCGSLNLRPRGWSPDHKQKAICLDCGKWFRLRTGQSLPGKYNTNTEHEWELPDATEEAQAMFVACKHTGEDFAGMRELIGVSPGELRQLAFLVDHGTLIRERVEEALQFRAAVLRSYNKLVAAYNRNRAEQTNAPEVV